MTTAAAKPAPEKTGTTKFIYGMRDQFFNALFEYFKRDQNLVMISADNGAPTLDQYSEELPRQFFQVGIAEQQLMGMACGMATEGKKVWTYAIAPFVTTRVHEFVKLDLCAMNLPICAIGIGAGYAYDIMGPTHHTVEDLTIMRVLPNLHIYSPADGTAAAALAKISVELNAPHYIRFDRAGIPEIYQNRNIDFSQGLIRAREGADLAIVTTGVMVHQALKAADALAERGIQAAVIDVFRVKPFNEKLLLEMLRGVPKVVTLEEHLLAGGLGGLVAETFVDHGVTTPLLRIGQRDRFVYDLGGREVLWELYGLDVPGILRQFDAWTKSRGL